MFSIGDGKRKFIFNYLAAKSIMEKEKNYRYPNYLTSYDRKFYDNPNNLLELKFDKINKEKSSLYYINKSKEIQKLKKDIQLKKIDSLINGALEKTNKIRNYSYNFKINPILNKKNFNKKNSNFNKIKLQNDSIHLPSFSYEKIKNNIIITLNQYFPEKYFNNLDKNNKGKNKHNFNKERKNKKKLDEVYKKIYTIKYIHPGSVDQVNSDINIKRENCHYLNPFITIYNKKNKDKFLSDIGKEKLNNRIDIGLNTIPYVY